ASTRLILSKAYSHWATRSPWWRILPRGPFSSSAPTPARKTNLPLPAPLTVTASEKMPWVQALWVNSFFSYVGAACCCAVAARTKALAVATATRVAQAYGLMASSSGWIDWVRGRYFQPRQHAASSPVHRCIRGADRRERRCD